MQDEPKSERAQAQLTPDAPCCAWCGGELARRTRVHAFCGQRCRQAAFRCRRELGRVEHAATPKRLGYADPPYIGRARMYRDQPSYAGEVDHRALVASLLQRYDGWALSAAADTLPQLLPLVPSSARVAVWHKPLVAQSTTRGAHNVWEAVIYVPARELRPGVPDVLRALPARGGGTLIGRKPLRFCTWLFALLGAQLGDAFDDLYPGSGIVGRAWSAFQSSGASRDASLRSLRDASSTPASDEASSAAAGDDASPRALDDASSCSSTSDATGAAA